MTDTNTIGACLIGFFLIAIIIGIVVMVVRAGRGSRYSQRELDALRARLISRKGQAPGHTYSTRPAPRTPPPRKVPQQTPPPVLAPARVEPPPVAYSTSAIGIVGTGGWARSMGS